MKTLTSVMTAVVLCAGLTLTGHAANEPVAGGLFAGQDGMHSVESHLAAIRQHQDTATMLEQKIQKLERRLDMFKNSYRDPKGLKRASWKRLIGAWSKELKDIRQHIAWHEEQIALLKA